MNGNKAIPNHLKNPKTAKEFAARAKWKGNIDDCSGAIEDYTSAIELDPQSPELYIDRGSEKGGVEDHRGAIEDYTRALELDHDGDILYIERFLVYSLRAASRYEVGDYQGTNR